ncbi:sugar phosphate isomerase/epimerase [Candidatus Bathyarchaeota archaeon]|nr:MAG: sugar phosphate isomerase/epimerase [Candidatus Bathyarchaeota archaeon]
MKISFTTLGCPNWTLEEIIRNASEMGFDGVEFRGIKDEMDISKLPEFTRDIEKTKKLLSDHKIAVAGIGVSAKFAVINPEEKKKHFDETRRNLKLAAQLDAPIVRVFGGYLPEGYTREKMVPVLVENLREMADEAEECGVKIALETHDDWTDSRIVSRIMKEVDHPYVGVLWDMHHPFRFNHEDPKETYTNLSPYIVGVHVKDSILDENGQMKLVMLGDGDVPIKEMLEMLINGGYEGYVTFEWEKRWHPELPEPEIAFPRFVEKIREWFG